MSIQFMIAESVQQLLEQAISLSELGGIEKSIPIYNQVIELAPEWGTPHYNLGLLYKYENEWELSYYHNQRAVSLDSSNNSAWWNLGIAATVLLDWRTAREAWNIFGLNLDINDEEVNLNLGSVPIRLNPNGSGEVVWCTRIDPARTIIKNIPLASSGYRFNDLLLNDGAAQGYRIRNGEEVPVFNTLQILKSSRFRTYSTSVYTDRTENIIKLGDLCEARGVEMENWSTLLHLCRQCSEGTPHEIHDHEIKPPGNEHHIGFASLDGDVLEEILNDWKIISLCDHSELRLELDIE